MDRRVLALVAVGAIGAAVLLGSLMSPRARPVETPVVAVPKTAPQVAAARAPEVPVRPRPSTTSTPSVPLQPTAAAIERPDGVLGGRPPVPPASAQMNEPAPEYRCRALGQQAQLIDQLTVIGRGGMVDEDQKKEMVGRVAKMSMRVFEEGESLWSGALNCDGISDVNLGPAAEFLAQMREELDLDENAQTEIDQALGVLDAVEWPDDAGEP